MGKLSKNDVKSIKVQFRLKLFLLFLRNSENIDSKTLKFQSM